MPGAPFNASGKAVDTTHAAPPHMLYPVPLTPLARFQTVTAFIYD